LKLSGTVNGSHVSHSIAARRIPSGIGGGIVEGVVSVTLSAVIHAALGHDNGDTRLLAECASECLSGLKIRLDTAISHQDSPASVVWQRITFTKWIASGTVVAILSVLVPQGAIVKSLWLYLLVPPIAVIVALPVYWFIHVAGLLCMPTPFFLDDPRGQQAMARGGTGQVISLRVLCAILALVLGAIMIGEVLLGYELYREHREQRKKKLNEPNQHIVNDME
jgi:hypothetical protein